jgi:hypothetical protein
MDRFLATGIAHNHTFHGRPIDQFDHLPPSAIYPHVKTMRLGLDDEQRKFDKETFRAEMRNADASTISTSHHCSDVRMFSLDPRWWTSFSTV